MEEVSHLLLVSRRALLCLVEKEKSLLLSQLATEENSVFEFEIEEVYCFSEG